MTDNVTITDIDVLKPGSYTDANGTEVEVTAAMIAEMAAEFEPGLQDAPAVVGHPKMDDPAYGWLRNFRVDKDEDGEPVLLCDAVDVDPEFAETLRKGRFKRKSLSFFMPRSKGNPKPGKYYPKHLGLLGARAPAVLGLKPIAFAADDEAVVIELAAPRPWVWRSLADAFSRIRDYLVEREGTEKADTIISSYVVNDLRDAAAELLAAEAAPGTPPCFASPSDNQGGQMATPEDIAAREAALTQREAALATREKSISDKEVALAAAETDVRRKGDTELVDKLIAEGRLRPTEKNDVLAELAALDDVDVTIELAGAEDGQKVKLTPRDALRRRLSASPKLIELGAHADKGGPGVDGVVEFAAPDGMAVDADRLALHARALSYQAAHKVDYLAAVRAVSKL